MSLFQMIERMRGTVSTDKKKIKIIFRPEDVENDFQNNMKMSLIDYVNVPLRVLLGLIGLRYALT